MPRVLPRARIGLLSAAVLGATIRDALLAPATGAWFGLYAHTDVYTQAGAQAAVTTLEAARGRTADIDSWYEPWGDTFPTWRQPWDFANGRIPMISWGKEPVDTILSGADDAYIAARADGIKALGKTVFLRWFWEMDGNRNLAYSQVARGPHRRLAPHPRRLHRPGRHQRRLGLVPQRLVVHGRHRPALLPGRRRRRLDLRRRLQLLARQLLPGVRHDLRRLLRLGVTAAEAAHDRRVRRPAGGARAARGLDRRRPCRPGGEVPPHPGRRLLQPQQQARLDHDRRARRPRHRPPR